MASDCDNAHTVHMWIFASIATVYTVIYLIMYTTMILAALCKGINHCKRKNKIPLSIIIPSYDETETILSTLDSAACCERNFGIEIIVVDDGIESDTTNYLSEIIKFKPVPCDGYCQLLKTKKVRQVYKSRYKGIPIYIIDKDNGKKADALNAGINLAHFDYIITLDADSVLDKKALKEIENCIDGSTLAVGGRVKPFEPKKYKSLNVQEKRSPSLYVEMILTLLQIFEYRRTFVIFRRATNTMNCVTLLSGAFTALKKSAVISVGGFNTATKGEDFDMTLKLQEYAHKCGGSVGYTDRAVVYTQTPFNLKCLWWQRVRWQQGMIEVISNHSNVTSFSFNVVCILAEMLVYEGFNCFFEPVILCFFIRRFPLFVGAGIMELCLITAISNKLDSCLLKCGFVESLAVTAYYWAFHLYLNAARIFAFIVMACPVFKNIKVSWGKQDRRKIII